MITTEDILLEELETLKDELIKAYDSKGMRASGKWANELEVEVGKNTGRILGLDYTSQLESGRSPNNGSSGITWDNAIQDIEDWMAAKNITPKEPNMTNKTLAYLITRKIFREGWDRKNYGGVELVSEVVTEQRIQKILDKIVDAQIVEFSSAIPKLFKNILNNQR